MANPRKFCDKIALHEQKMAEGTAAFEAIIREVSSTTRPPAKQDFLAQPSFGSCRGRSLPNVNQASSGSIDLQGALSSLENIQQTVTSHTTTEKTPRPRASQTRKKFLDRHRDCSPYGSVYLSPPETNWRRASSDSALHASVLAIIPNAGSTGSISTLGVEQGGYTFSGGKVVPMDTGQACLASKDGRPRSCEVPGISIFPSPDQNCVENQVNIFNNTGSLPDLANLNFPAPPVAPVDPGAQNNQRILPQKVIQNAQPSYISPVQSSVGVAPVRPDVQQSLKTMPVLRPRMNFVSPVFIQGNGHLLTSGGGTSIFPQGSHCLSDRSNLSLDLPTPPPPPYPSSFPQVLSPPPMITLTDETSNGKQGQILFADLSFKDNGVAPLSCLRAAGEPGSHAPGRGGNHWMPGQGLSVESNGVSSSNDPVLTDMLKFESSSFKNLLPPFRQTVCSESSSDSSKISASINEQKLRASSESVRAESGNNTAGVQPSQPAIHFVAGMSQCALSSSQNASYSVQPLYTTPADVKLQQLSGVLFRPELVFDGGRAGGGTSLIYNGSQSFNPPAFSLHSEIPQQRMSTIVPKVEKMEETPTSSNIGVYPLPTSEQQRVITSGNVILVPAHNSCSSSLTGQQLSHDELLYEQALLASLGDHWNQSIQGQQLPFAYTGSKPSDQLPGQQSSCLPQQKQCFPNHSDSIPDIVLSPEDLLLMSTDETVANAGNISASINDLSRDGFNTRMYLGDSFDADLLANDDDFLTLGLDPLEIDEIQMLSETTILTDPAVEDSFRLDRI